MSPPPLWRCRACRSSFPTPSFSEGPKFVDQETLQVVRFTQSRHLCPVCLSTDLTPPEGLARLAQRPSS